jgi:eukaryotic-like serine/threonine-protein kinase
MLTCGTRLGFYEIAAPLGAGGMGEVYRARDVRLGRDVAIKVLPDLMAGDAERIARFQREAQFLASLNHPQIGAIYGLEESGGVLALVLELVEGPTLADRIASGPIEIDEALAIARQIAEALEAAHGQGVIHRDLKPANVKVTSDGRVKVLDFGLAKLIQGDPGASALANSPTLSVQGTLAGAILGTAAYMSPEQARGKPLDRRTDIWSFGCVLFEMLAGKEAFASGETVSDVVAAILKSEPDWSLVPAETPIAVRTLLRRCLTKDPRERLHDIADARLEIRDAHLVEAEQRAATPRRGVGWTAAAVLAALSIVLAGVLLWSPAPIPADLPFIEA